VLWPTRDAAVTETFPQFGPSLLAHARGKLAVVLGPFAHKLLRPPWRSRQAHQLLSTVAMTDDCGRQEHNAATLRNLLHRLISEEERTRAIDPVKAAHLADAVEDLLTLISRLEAPADSSSPSDDMPDAPRDHAVQHRD
jgi:hypothetical protein